MAVKRNRKRISRRESTYFEREWTEADGFRIQRMRRSLGLTQKKLAEELGVDQSLVSAWERGKRRGRRPSGVLLKFAALPALDHDDRLWLIGKAGMDPETIEFFAAGFLRQSAEPSKPGETVAIKPMRKIEGEGPDLQLSKLVVPNWLTTKYVTVRDNFMQPIHKIGDILLIDESQRDPRKLDEGACVAVYVSPEHAAQQHWEQHRKRIEETHPAEEVQERRRTMAFPYGRVGLTIGWLRKEIKESTVVTARPTEGLPHLLTPNPPELKTVGWFFLEAPWLRTPEMLHARQPDWPPDLVNLSAEDVVIQGKKLFGAQIILGCVIAWIAESESAKREGKK
jgi:transcriptional regulator with XRE-family HTH domain